MSTDKLGFFELSVPLARNVKKRIRFNPVPAWETPVAINAICEAFDEILAQTDADPLLIIPMFVLDFLCIHPFNAGNGRMCQLLILLLLYRAGYIVDKYISIEKMIEQTKETYYEALQNSSDFWHEDKDVESMYRELVVGLQTDLNISFKEWENFRNYIIPMWSDIIRPYQDSSNLEAYKVKLLVAYYTLVILIGLKKYEP